MSERDLNSGPANADARVRAWFSRLAGSSGRARASLLSELRRDDPDIAADVESLAAYIETSEGVLDRSAADVAAELAPASGNPGGEPGPLPTVPGFRVTREIGRGGMGIVYEAQQEYPHRIVALKVIRPELLTPSVLQRFTLEAEALALLQDPGIAQLYEAGFFGEGSARTPYFAMELVEGLPLTTYARSRGLALSETVELFARVCDAVEHAHRRGVVHRDIKPGNIIVSGDGRVKVLDFGVARLTSGQTPDNALTRVGQVIGTIGYMSPEQIDGDPRRIDHRSDVYSLGVVLYELACGRVPLDMTGLSVTRAALTLRDSEPTRLGLIDPNLKGDIESIASKALEKDTDRRYATAAELAADLRRSLNHEVVLARPQTRTYLARKFVRRHRLLVASAAAVLLAIMAGAAGTAWQAVRATRERNLAAEQADRASQTADIVRNMIKAVRPEYTRGHEPTLREMLAGAAMDLARTEVEQPEVAADTHQVLCEAFGSLGDFEAALQHARAAYALHTRVLGEESEKSLEDAGMVASALSSLGRDAEAERTVKTALEISHRRWGEVSPITTMLENTYGFALSYQAPPRTEESLYWVSQALRHATQLYPATDHRRLAIAMDLSVALMEAERLDESRALMNEVYNARKATLGEDHPDTVIALGNLAVLDAKQGGIKEAMESCEKVLEKCTRVLGPTHPSTILNESNFAAFLVRSGKPELALEHSRHAYACSLAQFGPIHRDTLKNRGLLASVLKVNNRLEEADALGKEQYDLCLKTFGRRHYNTLFAATLMYDLAEAHDSLPEMRRWVEELKGSQWEQLSLEQLQAAEKKLKSEGKGG